MSELKTKPQVKRPDVGPAIPEMSKDSVDLLRHTANEIARIAQNQSFPDEAFASVETDTYAEQLGELPKGCDPKKYHYEWHKYSAEQIADCVNGRWKPGLPYLVADTQNHPNVDPAWLHVGGFVYHRKHNQVLMFTSQEAWTKWDTAQKEKFAEHFRIAESRKIKRGGQTDGALGVAETIMRRESETNPIDEVLAQN